MNIKNLICWVTVICGYVVLTLWGNSQPITMQRGRRSAWAKLHTVADKVSLPGARQALPEAPPPRPPPPPPPKELTRAEAERVIKSSALVEHFGAVAPRLREGIRVSPVLVDGPDQLERGVSRMAAPPDVPAGFAWPQFSGMPLTMLAQIRLADVAALDAENELPATGWLCFFYAYGTDPPVLGRSPADSGAAQVVYFDAPVEALQRVRPPAGMKETFPPCALRFWKEWNLPSLAEEPDLVWDDGPKRFYSDLCMALTGRPDEPGWSHLLGYAQDIAGPMRPVCELVSKGITLAEDTDLADPKLKSKLAKVQDWVLLLQVDLDGLQEMDAPPPQPATGGRGPLMQPVFTRRTEFSADRVYYWIRQADLKARDFNRAWAVRQEFSD